MTRPFRVVGLLVACALWASTAAAQSQTTDTRPATTTATGDTGLWFVPTAEVLQKGKWSISGYRVAQNYEEGFTNVADFEATVAAGLARAIEAFADVKLDTRIDRDLRPLFTSDPHVGGVIPTYPLVKQDWSGDHFGDILAGVKINLLSEERQKSAAVAVRVIFKIPTGDKGSGGSTGKVDSLFDFIVSKDAKKLIEVSGYGGVAVRGKADGVTSGGNAFRWGVGAAFPSHSPLRFTTEINGELPFTSTVQIAGLVAADGSTPPVSSKNPKQSGATLGVTWQLPSGVFIGAGATFNFPTADRANFVTDTNSGSLCSGSCPFGDFVDYQVRIGFHPGVGVYVPPPPPPPPPPPAPPPPTPVNRPPTVQATCEPCTVQVGQSSTVTANAQDPDGDTLRYRWSAPSGNFQNQQDRQTLWTAPQQPGTVPVMVTVDDGKGGTASASVNIQVVPPPPVVELTFEDVYFDFDRSTLRPEALRLLDDAVMKLQANPGRNITIEGHTCNIGTAEYNLALGERRAESVRAYLVSRGVAAGRLQVTSYGEENPKYDNAKEETRRLNRRAALTVRVQ